MLKKIMEIYKRFKRHETLSSIKRFLKFIEYFHYWYWMDRKKTDLILKVRQSRNDFFKPTILPKNERTNSTLLLCYLMSTCFRLFFWKKLKTPKRHFEINWPLHSRAACLGQKCVDSFVCFLEHLNKDIVNLSDLYWFCTNYIS